VRRITGALRALISSAPRAQPAASARLRCAAASSGWTLATALLCGCASGPPPAPLEPAQTLASFNARRLESLTESAGLPPPASGWRLPEWFAAALQLNPRLAEERADVLAAAAAERTAAEHPNPNMELFAEYLTSAAHSAAWLYGLSLDFLLRHPGERQRARRHAALETALAQSDLSESIWQVRAALRQALLDAVAAHDEAALLGTLIAVRQSLLDSDRVRLRLGDIARAQPLADEEELARARQRQQQAMARRADAVVRLAAAVGVPPAALEAVPLRWDDWAAVDALSVATPQQWRTEALVGRPQIVHALREYDLAEIGLQNEVARRWPQAHITPAYAWGGQGVREDALNDIARESALGVSFELPLLNQHQGPIGEALARRAAAGEHLKAVQAGLLEQIDRAELAWPAARQAWVDAGGVAALTERQRQAQQRALAEGAGERSGVLTAQIAAVEAQLSVLQAAYAAHLAYAALEDAYHRPLQDAQSPCPPGGAPPS
jgi:cobalt-zinc-cadmium efflux system outer membrane protein